VTPLLAIVVGLVILVAWTVLINLPREIHLRKLADSRRSDGDAFAAFQASLADIPADLLRTVYLEVQGWVRKDFPLRADDGLLATLDIDQGNLDVLLESLGLPETAALPGWTLGDLARAVYRHRINPPTPPGQLH
jgi:hypothetical protein